ncbi:hypothetical protein YC2023_001456 [Brassica napus]
MTTLVWNCRGLRSNLTVRRLEEMCREHLPDFLFLLETKNSSDHVIKLRSSLGFDHCYLVDPVGLSGGLALFWKKKHEVKILSASARIIDTEVKLGAVVFYMSFVYGDPVRQRRIAVWNELKVIALNRTGGWFLAGDFNELMNNSEKVGGPPRQESSFFDFRAMARDCRLKEIPSSGNRLSWGGVREIMENGVKEKVWVQCRLDRAFGNAEWFRIFPQSHTVYLEKTGSDHRPIFTSLANIGQRRTGRFMFDKRWCQKPEITEVIRRGWCSNFISGQGSVSERIKSCRQELCKWKRHANVNSSVTIRRLRRELEVEESKRWPNLLILPSLRLDLEKAYDEEEAFWKQKCKNSWLQVGDKNTKVFHGWVESRRMKNKIHSLIDNAGIEQFSEDEMGKVAVEYFQELFHSTGSADVSELLDGMAPRVTESMNIGLIKPISDAEIRRAVKEIKSDSTPGVDGMTGQFFQKFWNIVGPQVTHEVRRFFDDGLLPVDWNYTELCLLPKVQNPNQMKDLRPISLCSVVYKIVSKVLCDRLKVVLPHIVSPAQGAFVAGRLISDNLLIAHEMVHGLRTNPACKSDFIAIKTDMSKAYDRVEWDFLEALFLKLGFHQRWVSWIMLCVRSVSYFVILNGQSYGHFTPERGIRQGDPLSPFLFILCAEALVHTMSKAEQEGVLTGMKLAPSCPAVQHLLFADDSFFLCRASLAECTEFLRRLKLYGDCSGQMINFQKSAITFGAGIDPIMRRVLAELLNIEKEGGDGKYLGLPECFSGSKQQLLAFIGEKMSKRLKGWFAKKLSFGGKEVLLKSIAMALPVYAMSCFRLTKHLCQKIMSAMASFWWDENDEKKKIHWISWKKLCISKENGGLGFRDIEDFNQALLAKQAWRLLNDPTSLIARIYKGRYFASSDFMNSGKGYRPSYAWRSILFGRELLNKGLMKSIGNGNSTFVWSHNWILDETPRRPINKQPEIDINLRVSSLIGDDGQWDVNKLQCRFPQNEVTRIRQLPVGDVPDRDIWAYSPNGSYTVKSGYKVATQAKETAEVQAMSLKPGVLELKGIIWKVATLPKIRNFLWRAASGALAVAERLNTRGLNLDLRCKICKAATESIEHVLFKCSLAHEAWSSAGFQSLPHVGNLSVIDCLSAYLHMMNDVLIPLEQRLAIPWILWTIWKNRNMLLYAETQVSITIQIKQALEEACTWHELNKKAVSLENITGLNEETKRWDPPLAGYVKCNFHANWRNAALHSGVAFIVRDQRGNVLHHARDAITFSPNRITSELRCLVWVLKSMKDLGYHEVVLASDFRELMEAVLKPKEWPRYRSFLQEINILCSLFRSVAFETESANSNQIAREIAKSVLRDGRLQSYLALGGPAWLHQRILRETVQMSS